LKKLLLAEKASVDQCRIVFGPLSIHNLAGFKARGNRGPWTQERFVGAWDWLLLLDGLKC
jgi:hypothetical protein